MVINTNDTLTLKLSSDSLKLNLSPPVKFDLKAALPDIVYTSLYELAVKNGYEGTEQEWLDSLGATITIGTITDDEQISVTNSGTAKDAIFDFTFPSKIDYFSQDNTVIMNCGTASEVI